MRGDYDDYSVERAWLLFVFGENLRTLRKRRSLAQEGLAEVANLHRNEIGVLERGQGEPGLLTLLILADTLEIPLEGLTEGVPAPDASSAERAVLALMMPGGTPLPERACENCGEEMPADRHRAARFCSDPCRRHATYLRERSAA